MLILLDGTLLMPLLICLNSLFFSLPSFSCYNNCESNVDTCTCACVCVVLPVQYM